MAAIWDPREYLKNILTPIMSGGTIEIVVMFEGGPENLRHLFYVNDYNAVITIGRPTVREEGVNRRIQDIPLRYPSRVPINVVARATTGYSAPELLNEIYWNILSIVELSAQGLRATITVTQSQPRNQIIGGFDPLWMDSYIVDFRPTQSIGGLPP